MKVRTETTEDGAAIVRIEGEVDMLESPKLRSELMKLVEDETPVIAVDLANVGFMDSAGIATLVEGYQGAREYGGKFKLVNLSQRVLGALSLARLDRVFEIAEDEHDI
jgi:anti-sigma B factor antagonist